MEKHMILRKFPNTISLVTKDVHDKEPSNKYTYMNFIRYETQEVRGDIDVEGKIYGQMDGTGAKKER
jgi:hypothetical protein